MVTTPPDKTDSVQGTHRMALAVLCLAQFVVVLAFQGTALVLPQVERAFALSSNSSQWLISVNALTFGALLLPAGRAADAYGHRRLFMIGTALFVVASTLAGFAPAIEWLIGARGLQGAATAMFAPAAFALLTDTFPEGEARRKAIAFWSAAGPVGGIGAVLLGGLLADVLGWRAVFMIGAVVVLPPLLLSRSVLNECETRSRDSFNPFVAIAGVAAIGLIVYALGSIPASGDIPIQVLVALAAGLGLGSLFVVGEKRSASPLVPRALFQQRELLRPIITAFFHGASTNTWIFFFTIYLQQMRGVSPWESGLALIPCNVAVIGGSAWGGRFGGRVGYRRLMAGGLGIAAAGLFAMTAISIETSWMVSIVVGTILIGFGLGLAQVGLFEAATEQAAVDDRGAVGAGINTAAQLGTAIGLAGLVVISGWVHEDVDRIQIAFAGGGVIALLGVLVILILPGVASSERGRGPLVDSRQARFP